MRKIQCEVTPLDDDQATLREVMIIRGQEQLFPFVTIAFAEPVDWRKRGTRVDVVVDSDDMPVEVWSGGDKIWEFEEDDEDVAEG